MGKSIGKRCASEAAQCHTEAVPDAAIDIARDCSVLALSDAALSAHMKLQGFIYWDAWVEHVRAYRRAERDMERGVAKGKNIYTAREARRYAIDSWVTFLDSYSVLGDNSSWTYDGVENTDRGWRCDDGTEYLYKDVP